MTRENNKTREELLIENEQLKVRISELEKTEDTLPESEEQLQELFPDIEQSWIDKYGSVVIDDKPIQFTEYNNTDKYFKVDSFSPAENLFVMVFEDITETKKAEAKLGEAEEKYRKIVKESIQGMIIAQNNTLRLSFASDTMKNITGYTPAELMNFSPEQLKNLIYPEDKERFFGSFMKRLKGGDINRGAQYRIINKNTEVRWVELFTSLIGFTGSPATQTIFIDIIRRKKAEDKLKASNMQLKASEQQLKKSLQYYRDLTENSSDIILVVNKKGTIEYASNSMQRFMGYEPEDLIGQKIFKFIHPADLPRAIIDFGKAILTKDRSVYNSFRVFHKDGTERIIEGYGKNLFSNPIIAGFVMNLLDVSDKKKTELALRESEQRYSRAQEIGHVGNWEYDIKTTHFWCSHEAKRIYGFDPEAEDFTVDEVESCIPDRENVHQALIDLIENEKPYDLEFEIITKDKGESKILHSIAILEKDDNGNTLKVSGVIQNITKEKQYEKNLIETKEKAEESDRLKSAFLANMSHEIRTPMNGILGFSNLLKEPKLTGEQQQKYIGIIEKSGSRMLNIINDIIDISKIEAGLMTVDITPSDINEQIKYIYTFFKPEVEANGMKLSYKNTLPSKEAIINTDREKVFATLTNLVKNAIKYTNKGTIEFGYNKKADYIEFFVKDSGIGIPKNRQEAIFERFIQADIGDKMARQGAGLGLAISRAYIEMLDGKLWVESEEGIGSTFYFTLPYNAQPEEKSVIENIFPAKEKKIQVKKLKVLIAEDDEPSEMLISIELEEFTREKLKVTTGIAAINVCRNHPDIDLVLMDIQMPGMNGYDATREIRKFNNKVIIIAQTAFALSGDKEKALEAGCNDYIAKPINKGELLSLIQKHFENT